MEKASRPKVAATLRPALRKSQIKSLRASGNIPGTLYGKGVAPLSIQVSSRVIGGYLGAHGTGALLDLELGGEVTPAVLREVDYHGTSGVCTHIAFQRIALDQQFHTSIPLRFEGADQLILLGLTLQPQLDFVELSGRADLLPEFLSIDVSGYRAGDVVQIGVVELPDGVSLTKDAATAAAIITAPRTTAPEPVAA